MRANEAFCSSKLFLTAYRQPQCQRFRKLGLPHALLHFSNVVRNAPELHDFMLQIGNGKSGARISIARLSDGAWIQQIALAFLQTKRAALIEIARMQLQNFQLSVLIGKSALVVRVAVKSDRQAWSPTSPQALAWSVNTYSSSS